MKSFAIFCELFLLDLRSAPCGLAPIRARTKIKPAKMPVEFLVVVVKQNASCHYAVFVIELGRKVFFMDKKILSKFYKTRTKSTEVSENNVLLERFITLNYLKKYIKPSYSVVEIGAGIRSYSPELVKLANCVLAVDLFQDNLDRLSILKFDKT